MRKPGEMNTEKASRLAWVFNFVEIAILLSIIILVSQGVIDVGNGALRPLALVFCVILMVNDMLNISLNTKWMRADEQYEMLKDALNHVERLNVELRTQKHDFVNHLQVVFSLVEMEENAEACKYIEKVNGDMQRKSLVARTERPAVNALLQAKLGDCETRGIDAKLRIMSNWQLLPIEEWEMCRVLGNIIDNAIEAMGSCNEKRLEIELYEDGMGYGFSVANNGPKIAPAVLERIWWRGFSTKGENRGMGLHIVKSIMNNGGGSVEILSTEEMTVFTGYLPLGRGETLPQG